MILSHFGLPYHFLNSRNNATVFISNFLVTHDTHLCSRWLHTKFVLKMKGDENKHYFRIEHCLNEKETLNALRSDSWCSKWYINSTYGLEKWLVHKQLSVNIISTNGSLTYHIYSITYLCKGKILHLSQCKFRSLVILSYHPHSPAIFYFLPTCFSWLVDWFLGPLVDTLRNSYWRITQVFYEAFGDFFSAPVFPLRFGLGKLDSSWAKKL